MKQLIVAVLLDVCLFPGRAAAQSGAQQAKRNVGPVALPAYDAYSRIALYAATRTEYGSTAGDRFCRFDERVPCQ